MDLTNPANALVPTLDAVVAVVLAGTSRPLTGREVHRLARTGSQRGIQLVLHRMERTGLVDVVEAGPSRMYTLNREHVVADAALALVDLRGRLFERIRAIVAEWSVQPVAAAVFGSAARGDGGPDSDVDVLLVRPTQVDADEGVWAACVDDLSRSIRRWSGNPASIIQATPQEMAAMVAQNAPIVAELSRDAIPLTEVSVLAVAKRRGR